LKKYKIYATIILNIRNWRIVVMIRREMYLKKIRDSYDSELIKVIIGVRRSGKSVLMMQIIEELKKII
jgi:predicted AAA+ superfamily ATPase